MPTEGRIERHPSARVAERCCVYTPPGYTNGGDTKLPVLYLLHGVADTETTWQNEGGIKETLDSLRQEKPMIVVMPYGFLSYAEQLNRSFPDAAMFDHYLTCHLMPSVERVYNVNPSRRAIAGISMGGKQALEVGLNHLDLFCALGSISAAIQNVDLFSRFPHLTDGKSCNNNLELFYIRCGRRDAHRKTKRPYDLYLLNTQLVSVLLNYNVRCDPMDLVGLDFPDSQDEAESEDDPHRHNWIFWRRVMETFLPTMSLVLSKERGN